MSKMLIWVCLGGALGSGARYLLAEWIASTFDSALPLGTLAVNVLGSFLLAAIMYVGLQTTWISETTRLTLATGVMGGFTTYSTFSYETMRLLQSNAWGLALANVLATVVGCLVACFLGWAAARALVGA
jgi:fluoride exporter